MANDLATLNGYLDTQLREATVDTIWTSAEKNFVLTWAVAGLWPRLSRELPYATTTIDLVAATHVYNAPTGVMAVSRVDLVDADGIEHGPLQPGSWEALGDPLAGVLRLHISPTTVAIGGTVRLIGYGRYDVTTNLIPDDFVPLVLATARAELYRRMGSDRAMFEQWAARNQGQDTSINELLQLINEADSESIRLRRQWKTWQRPVPARHG